MDRRRYHGVVHQRRLGGVRRQQILPRPGVQASGDALTPIVARLQRAVGEHRVVNPDALQMVLDVASRLLRREGGQLIGQGHPLTNRLQRPPRQLLPEFGVAHSDDGQGGGGIPRQVEQEPECLQEPRRQPGRLVEGQDG